MSWKGFNGSLVAHLSSVLYRKKTEGDLGQEVVQGFTETVHPQCKQLFDHQQGQYKALVFTFAPTRLPVSRHRGLDRD